MTSPRRLARIAGILYLILALGSGFAQAVRASIIVAGDASATANSIRDSATLFRLSFVADLVGFTFFLFTAMAIYLLLQHVNRLVAAAMVTLVAISVAITSLDLVFQFTALLIATSPGYARAFGAGGSDALVMLFADLNTNGSLISSMFFGLWLLPLGFLVFKSGYFPKVLGVLLAIGCFGYVVDLFLQFLAPAVSTALQPIYFPAVTVGEISFMLWLIFIGVKVPRLTASVPAAA
jgi:hypothetical protein